ncbi:MAG TPA: fluoride efflux transporter CrcB [Bacteroidales bacterium]|nr:fluoride efflux transporter CrcB [Bacteroidales bacterium]
MIRNILLIGTGGFIGSVARYFVSRLNLTMSLFSIPAGTLLVNITGSFIIGFLAGLSDRSTVLSTEARLFLMVGICGGFTTFSSFTLENLTLIHNGQLLQVVIYSSLSFLLGMLAVFAGYVLSNVI